MPSNKKHHFVPRFYLSRFAAAEASIQLYNFRIRKIVRTANIKNRCYRDYMYGKELDLEHGLAQLEGAFSPLIKKIERLSALPPPLSEDHETLCVMTILQYARTAYSADAVNEFTDGFWRSILKHDPRVTQEMLDRVKITQKEPARFAVTHFLQNYHLIMDLSYRLLVAPSGTEFITSDNPVVMYNQLMEFSKAGSATGVASKGLQIFYPLSPTHLLFMFDRHSYTVQPKRRRKIELTLKADVDALNVLQAANALENIYFSSPSADVFRVVERGRPYRPSKKTTLKTFAGKEATGRGSEIIAASREEPKTNLSLSFVSIPKPVKEWRRQFQTQRIRPAVVLRDPAYVADHEAFRKQVDAGKYQPTEFFRYLTERPR